MKKKTQELKTKKPAKTTTAKSEKPSSTTPLRHKKQAQDNEDERIDEHFPVYPYHPPGDADLHNGSAHAFERTEESGYDPEDGYDDGSFED